jgi:hypothetical protein
VFEDQLVLKCDNGRKLTVPWEARLSEACGEVDIPRAAQAAAPKDEAQERQKEILMSRVREQLGNVDERHVTVESPQGGTEPHFSPQMREILKRYEVCRKSTKNSPTCAAERNQAMAALSSQPVGSEPAAVEAKPTPKAKSSKPAAKPKPVAAKPAPKPEAEPAEHVEPIAIEPVPVEPAEAAAKPEPEITQTAATAPPAATATAATPSAAAATPAPAPDRTAREQKIAEDYAQCMRARPKFECETARAAALKALDAPARSKAKPKTAASKTPSPGVASN